MRAKHSSLWLGFVLGVLPCGALYAEQSRFDTDLFALVEAVHQDEASTSQGNSLAATPTAPGVTANVGPSDTKTDSRRYRLGIGFDHSLTSYPGQVINDSLHVEEARSFAGKELDLTGTGTIGEHWAGPRLGLDLSFTESAGRYLDSDAAPISAVLGANYGNAVTYYRRQVISGGTTYAMTRLWQLYANIELSRNYSLGLTSIGEGITFGTKIFHTFDTTSRLQAGYRTDRQVGFETVRTESVSYRIDHTFSRADKGDLELGEDVVFTPGIGRNASLNYMLDFTHSEGDVTYNAFGGRSLARRPVTNEETLNDSGGVSMVTLWKPQHEQLSLSASRVAERNVFGVTGLSTETIDTGRIEFSIGVIQRTGFPAGRDYDRVVLSAQEERAHSVLGDVRRETLGLGYYATL